MATASRDTFAWSLSLSDLLLSFWCRCHATLLWRILKPEPYPVPLSTQGDDPKWASDRTHSHRAVTIPWSKRWATMWQSTQKKESWHHPGTTTFLPKRHSSSVSADIYFYVDNPKIILSVLESAQTWIFKTTCSLFPGHTEAKQWKCILNIYEGSQSSSTDQLFSYNCNTELGRDITSPKKHRELTYCT
jgi:hypothetical protein